MVLMFSHFHQVFIRFSPEVQKSENEDTGHNAWDCSIKEICTEICTDQRSNLHRFPGTESLPAGAGDPTSGLREIRGGENIPSIPENFRPIREPVLYGGFSRCKSGCKDVKTSVNVKMIVPVDPADYIALPAAKDEPGPASATGRPTSSVKRGGGLYLCYDCLKRAKRPAKAQPLPGVLERSEENL